MTARERAEQIANSVWLAAVNRVGVPLLLAAAIWGGSTVVALDRRMAQAEQADKESTRRIEQLETRREADRNDINERDQRTQRLAADIRADVAAVRADQAAMLRAIQRVEQFIDRTHTLDRRNP